MRIKLPFKRCWIAEAVTAAGAIGSSVINALSQQRTNAINRQQAEYAFQQQQQAIQRQNEYNSPDQQVLRMKAAGLNPSLAYGANGEMVGNQADIPAYNPIPAEAPNIGNVGTGIAEAVRTGIEVKDLERRNNLAVAEIYLSNARAFQALNAGELTQAQRTEIVSMLGYKIDALVADIRNKDSLTHKAYQDIRESASRVQINEKTLAKVEAEIKNLDLQSQLTAAQAYRILALLPHEVKLMDSEAAFNWIQTKEGRERIGLLAAQTAYQNHLREYDWAKYNLESDKFNHAKELDWANYNLDTDKFEHNEFMDYMHGVTDISLGIGKLVVGAAGAGVMLGL